MIPVKEVRTEHMSNENITMIIPTIPKDYTRVKRDFGLYFDYLPIKEIVFVGPAELEQAVADSVVGFERADSVRFINENDLIPYSEFIEGMKARIRSEGFEIGDNSRPGWYYQQFLKLAYASVCKDDYYLVWDSDTIPLRKISFFDQQGRPFLDTKREYNPGYFRTIKNLFGFDKAIEQSFISEHMLFSKSLVIKMLDEICALPLNGDSFFEKIMYAVDIDNMKLGFSEFETYGTWIMNRHPDYYVIREWKSMRRANIFVDSSDLTPDDRKWLARDYDSASFESYHPLIPDLAELFHNKEYRKNVSARELYETVVSSGIFGEYSDGMVIEGDLYTPV